MSKKRVVVWSTGTVGRHAIKGIDAHPDLELVGVWVSNPDKVGQDVGRLAGLDRDLGVVATNDKQALYDLAPEPVLHAARTDDPTRRVLDRCPSEWMRLAGFGAASAGAGAAGTCAASVRCSGRIGTTR